MSISSRNSNEQNAENTRQNKKKTPIGEQQFYKTIFLNKDHSCYRKCNLYTNPIAKRSFDLRQDKEIIRIDSLEFPSPFLEKIIDHAIDRPYPMPPKTPERRLSEIKAQAHYNKKAKFLAEEIMCRNLTKAKLEQMTKKTQKAQAEYERKKKEMEKIDYLINDAKQLYENVKENMQKYNKHSHFDLKSTKPEHLESVRSGMKETNFKVKPIKPGNLQDKSRKDELLKLQASTVYGKYLEGLSNLKEQVKVFQPDDLLSSYDKCQKTGGIKRIQRNITDKYLNVIYETTREAPIEYGGFSYHLDENQHAGMYFFIFRLEKRKLKEVTKLRHINNDQYHKVFFKYTIKRQVKH